MANTRKLHQEKKDYGLHKIKTMEIIDLTQSNEEISVVMKMTKNIQTGDSLKDARQETLDSPWREDDISKAYLKQRKETQKLKDPLARLRKVNELLGRQ